MTMHRPWTVLAGDCRQTLADLPVESIDACVTDTPYGLSTLLDPPNLDREALWAKLTSGAKEAPIRTLLRAWLDTGENPQVKGRGFMGKEWDALVPAPSTWKAIWRVLKPGAYCLAFGGTRTYALIEMSLRLADFEVEDHVSWMYGQGFCKRVRLELKIDEHHEPADVRAERLRRAKVEKRHIPPLEHPSRAPFVGWDRALRPGWEPIIVACKPLRGTVAENALAHGTGGLHVDACRLERGDAEVTPQPDVRPDNRGIYGKGLGGGLGGLSSPLGGYPANVAMDEETAAELDRMSGPCGGSAPASGPTFTGESTSVAHGKRNGVGSAPAKFHGRADGASRFFYTAKASTSERDAGLEDLPPLTAGERCDRKDGSAGINAYAGTNGDGGRNPHPTVKPLSLMRWLCRLASPPGAWNPDESRRPLILDPFAGSGSTLVAALQEGVRVIGCELDEKMADVARRRCQHAYALPREEADIDRSGAGPGTQATLF